MHLFFSAVRHFSILAWIRVFHHWQIFWLVHYKTVNELTEASLHRRRVWMQTCQQVSQRERGLPPCISASCPRMNPGGHTTWCHAATEGTTFCHSGARVHLGEKKRFKLHCAKWIIVFWAKYERTLHHNIIVLRWTFAKCLLRWKSQNPFRDCITDTDVQFLLPRLLQVMFQRI